MASAALLLMGLSACSSSSQPPAKSRPTQVARTAGGDIPDTATYLRFHAAQYSIEYVEGWVRHGLTRDGVSVTSIDSIESVTVQARSAQPLLSYVRTAGVARTAKEYQHFIESSVASLTLPAGPAARLSFKAKSAPDPVTGKQVTLAIDRYYVSGRRKIAIITLATPLGVDNVDAFRRIARSFTWTNV